ncbi:Uncharacterized protein SCF082_LOCUS21552, partial [Durusdinium trenchii]
VGDLSKTIARRIGVKAGRKLVLSAGDQILEDPSKPLQEVSSPEISYFVRQVCAREAAIGFRRALAERKKDMHATVTDAIASLTFGHEFNQSLQDVTLPSSLQTLTFGRVFNQSLEGVTLPSSLCHLAKQPADFDLGRSVQPELERCYLAKQPADFDLRS